MGLPGRRGGDLDLPALTKRHPPQARLRGNIANPSSPELLHFLFGPLQMVSLRRPLGTPQAQAGHPAGPGWAEELPTFQPLPPYRS